MFNIASALLLLHTVNSLNCGTFNIDGFLTECSADFPAEQEALVTVEARVSQLESEVATSEDLAATEAALDALRIDLLTLEGETATSASLASTGAEVDALKASVTVLKNE